MVWRTHVGEFREQVFVGPDLILRHFSIRKEWKEKIYDVVGEERKRGRHVWTFRWWETDVNGDRIYRKQQIGDLGEYPNATAANVAVDALRLTINHQSQRNGLSKMTVQLLWEHYTREELPSKDFSTQDGYISMLGIGSCHVGVEFFYNK